MKRYAHILISECEDCGDEWICQHARPGGIPETCPRSHWIDTREVLDAINDLIEENEYDLGARLTLHELKDRVEV